MKPFEELSWTDVPQDKQGHDEEPRIKDVLETRCCPATQYGCLLACFGPTWAITSKKPYNFSDICIAPS